MKTLKHCLISIASAGILAADDHGDTRSLATSFSNPNISGILETAGDTDFFRIDVTTPGLHWIYSSGTTDTHGTLYDQAGNFIAGGGNDENDGYRDNFYFSLKLQPGTYYLGVKSGSRGTPTGSYKLSLRSPKNALTFQSPNLLANLSEVGDRDLYRVIVERPGPFWFTTTGNTDTHGSLYDEAGNFLAGGGNDENDGKAFNFRFSTMLQVGTYYLLVTNGSQGTLTGDYTLSWRNRDNAIKFDEANRDGSLGVRGDLDLYEVRIDQRAPFWMYTTGTTDTFGRLYDESGNFVAGGGNDQDDGAGRNFSFSDVFMGGTYYLLIEDGESGNQTGPYTLHMRDQARSTALLKSGTGDHSISHPGDLDLYSFATTGGPFRFESTGPTDTWAALYNAAGGFEDGGGNDENDGENGINFAFEGTLTPGVYYLLVRGSKIDLDTGNYRLISSFPEGQLTRLSSAGITITGERASRIEISSNENWTVTNLPSWVTASRTSGSGHSTLNLSYAPNLTGKIREASITIGGQSYQINQKTQGDLSGQVVPGQLSLELGVLISFETEVGTSYRIQTSDNMRDWLDTGASIIGDGTRQELVFASSEARNFFRAVPQ